MRRGLKRNTNTFTHTHTHVVHPGHGVGGLSKSIRTLNPGVIIVRPGEELVGGEKLANLFSFWFFFRQVKRNHWKLVFDWGGWKKTGQFAGCWRASSGDIFPERWEREDRSHDIHTHTHESGWRLPGAAESRAHREEETLGLRSLEIAAAAAATAAADQSHTVGHVFIHTFSRTTKTTTATSSTDDETAAFCCVTSGWNICLVRSTSKLHLAVLVLFFLPSAGGAAAVAATTTTDYYGRKPLFPAGKPSMAGGKLSHPVRGAETNLWRPSLTGTLHRNGDKFRSFAEQTSVMDTRTWLLTAGTAVYW